MSSLNSIVLSVPMPIAFPVQNDHPPDALSASVRLALLKAAPHPSCLAFRLSSWAFSSPMSLVSCVQMISALETERTLYLALFHELVLLGSMAHQPSLTHNLSTCRGVSSSM